MAPRGHEPRKRNRLRDDSDSDMDDDKEPPRGLLFSSKGKEKESDSEMLIDVDPSDEEAGLDGAVGHMSLDGPSTDPDPDPDVDVVGVSSGVERVGLAVSPIQTRARRRVKEATAAASKRGKRVPRAGTRTSSRLAAMTGTS
ncbi:hypothetical protein OPQ81_000466 [Rhizoctonia solani]|nr:hypothetical protein OPQ81_000466 [Rhizoctonia solani]